MALINTASREIVCKVVYVGAGASGKTSNLTYIQSHLPSDQQGQVMPVTSPRADRLFDLLRLDLGLVRGFQTRFHLYAGPGAVRYEAARAELLRGADGVVVVADSRRDRLEENYGCVVELEAAMTALGKDLAVVPLVVQWNKRDLPDALSVPVLEHYVNRRGVPSFEATASAGLGVFPTLRAVTNLVLTRL